MITVTLNGQPHVSACTSISDLPGELKLAPETLLIEHNEIALLRSEWAETKLQEGDCLEVLHVAAGG